MSTNMERFTQLHAWLTQDPPSDHLWHFTSPAGLKGIADDAEVWATSAAWLNDAAEGRIAMDVAREQLTALRTRDPGDATGNRDSFVSAAIEQLTSLRPDFQTFTVSFTEQTVFDPDVYGPVWPPDATTMDRLFQWQAYCPPDGGFALGVPGRHLKNIAEDQDFYLARCIYNRSEAAQLVQELVVHHLAAADGEYPGSQQTRDLLDDLRTIAPIVKHPSFAHEREWRVIKRLYERDTTVRVRATDTALIPYLGLKLLTDVHPQIQGSDSFKDTLGVFVGPRSDFRMTPEASEAQADANDAIHILFNTSPLELGWTNRSLVPYRGRL